MFFIVFFAVLFFLLFITWLLKVRLFGTLRITPQDKYIKFELFLKKYKISDYIFVLQRNTNERLEVQYIKKGLLIHTYKLNELLKLWKEKKASKNVSFLRDIDMFVYKDKVVIEKVSIHTDLGWDDAATTAILHGFFIAGVNTLLGKLYESYGLPKKSSVIKVNPFYQQKTFNAAVEITFAMRFVYLLLARLKTHFFNLKQKRLEAQKREKVFKDSLTHKNAC